MVIAAAGIGLAGTLVASKMSSNAAGNAAKSQENSAANGQAIQQQEFQQVQNNEAPYAALGSSATNALTSLNSGNTSGFSNSPDYNFALSQGENQINQGAAARGNMFTGGNAQDLATFNQGTASQYLNNYRNNLMSQIGVGQAAASATNSAGTNSANQSTSLAVGAGQAAAQGTLGQSSIYNNGINQISNGLGQFASSYNPTGSSGTGAISSGSNYLTSPSNFTSDFSGLGGGSSYSLGSAGTGVG